MGGYAWVTLATNNSYSLGALVLAHSLKKANTAHKLVVLITSAVSQSMREQLQTVFDLVKLVDVLDSKDEAHLALMKRPELGITFTKIHCWKLVEFEKCVFLDADTLVVRNCDEMFEREELSAAPDASWPDCFNSGVFVYRPSLETYTKIIDFATKFSSFDGGDQGLLNQFFGEWATEDIKKHLPFVYNLTSIAAYSYIPAFKHYGSEARIVHFIGQGKPWLQQLDPTTRTVVPSPGSEHLAPLLQQWWDLFCEKVHPGLDKNLENSNDGMSHPPVEANIVPVALTDEPQTAVLNQPCTPYREKDDFRQHNLPYHPFNVEGPSGELLNEEFLLASVVPPEPEQSLDEQQRQEEEVFSETNWGEQKHEENKNEETIETNEEIVETTEVEERKTEEVEKENRQEDPPPPKDPFDYNSFFPDETCISSYLEKNVETYQPFDNHQQQHNNYVEPEPEESPSLPRFLTIPQNDQRQSGNVEDSPTEKVEQPPKAPTPPMEFIPPIVYNQTEPVEEKRELSKSKSTPSVPLEVETAETPPQRSIWKSQPDLNINRKFSMPKLKPILPKQRSFSKSIPSGMSKITLYTEFIISSEYKDPIDLPNDKIDFVETHIRKETLKRSKSDADIRSKFGPVPYIPSPEVEKPVVPRRIPHRYFDECYDLTQCKRQMGNKPKPKDANKGKETIHALPALKPIVPAKDKKSTLLKKRKSKELGEGGREKIPKREPKKPKERKREPIRNVSTNGNNLDEILQRLKEYSKNYQHFFGVTIKPQPKSVTVKNARVQTSEEHGGECESSETFERLSTPVSRRSRETQTPKKLSSPTDGLELQQFRNYIKDQKEANQKGLLSIQDILSESSTEILNKASTTVNVPVSIRSTSEYSECQRSFPDVTTSNKSLQNHKESSKSTTTPPECNHNSSNSLQNSPVETNIPKVTETSSETSAHSKTATEISEVTKISIETPVNSKKTADIPKVTETPPHSKTATDIPKVTETSSETTQHSKKTAEIPKVMETPTHAKNTTDIPKATETSIETPVHSKKTADIPKVTETPVHSKKTADIPKVTETPPHSKTATDIPKVTETPTETPAHSKKTTEISKVIETPTHAKNTTEIPKLTKTSTESPTYSKKTADIPEVTETPLHSKKTTETSSETPVHSKKATDILEITETSPHTKTATDIPKVTETSSETPVHSKNTTDIPNSTKESPTISKTHMRSSSPVLESPIIRKSSEDSEATATIPECSVPETEGDKNNSVKKPEKEEVIIDIDNTQKKSKPQTVEHSRKPNSKEQNNEMRKKEVEESTKTNGFAVGNSEEKKNFQMTQNGHVIQENGCETEKKIFQNEEKPKKPQKPEELLCVPDFETPRSSRVSPPNSETTVATSEEKSRISCVRNVQSVKTPSNGCANGNATPSNDSPEDSPSPTPQTGDAQTKNLEDLKTRSGIAGAIAQLHLEEGSQQSPGAAAASSAHEEYLRRQNWEVGNMDYMGKDSFDNIWSKICQTIEAKDLEEKSAVISQPPMGGKESEVPSKCPEFIETLPGEPAGGPLEDDEIIFSKPENRQSNLTNIAEEEEAKTGEGRAVKLSDILQPGVSSPQSVTPGGKSPDGKVETPLGGADKSVPQTMKQPETPECKTVAIAPQTPVLPPSAVEQKPMGVSQDTKPQAIPECKTTTEATPTGEQKQPEGKPSQETKPQPEPVKPETIVTPQTTLPTSEAKPQSPPQETKSQPAKEESQTPSATPQSQPVTSQPEKTEPKPTPTAPSTDVGTKPQPVTPPQPQIQPGKTEPTPTAPSADVETKPQPATPSQTQPEKAEPKPTPTAPSTDVGTKPQPVTPPQPQIQPGKTEPTPTAPSADVGTKPQPVLQPQESKPQPVTPPQTQPEKAEPKPTPTAPSTDVGTKPQPEPTKPESKVTPTPSALEIQPQSLPQQPEPEKPENKTAATAPQTPSPAIGQPETKPQPPPSECKTVAVIPQPPTTGGQQQPPPKPTEECKTVAIPSPPIVFPGAPFDDKKGKETEKPQVVSEPIPLPPPETPQTSQEPEAKKSRSSSPKEEGKTKKGVFSKLLEMVGVAPKDKNGGELSKSVFYDLGEAAPKQETLEEQIAGVKETEKPMEVTPEEKKTPTKEPPTTTKPVEMKTEEQKSTPKESEGKSKEEQTMPSPIPKPMRKSPSPKLTIPQKPPETAVTMPTPPPQVDVPPRKNSGLLKVEDTILETPPVGELPKETVESVKGKASTEIEEIIGKAKSEVESLLQGAEENSELINTMKLMMGGEQPGKSTTEEVEELRVTSEEERMRHKGEVVSSKLSDQILKAIPPPRRKAISEASASTSAIPKPTPTAPEQKSPPGESKPKPSKPSSIPVPPPRNKGKPSPPSPPKGKGKK